MPSRRTVRIGALGLLSALLAAGSGLPTHDHRDDAGGGAVLLDGDHHTHGVPTVASAKRLAAVNGAALPPSTPVVVVWGRAIVVQPAPVERAIFPQERVPPPARPRAPPASA